MRFRPALYLLAIASALSAQTPAKAPPCPSSSVLLTAQPIYGVGLTTIRNACPAFLTALDRWYTGHPSATIADFMAAIRGTPPVVTPPPVVVPPPVVSPPPAGAHYSDNFSSYTSTADLVGRFWKAPNHDGGPSGSVTYDTVEKAMRYDWPARPTTTCSADLTNAMLVRWNPPPTGATAVWVRFTSKESPNFEHGRSGCGSAKSYKFFLLDVESSLARGRAGLYLGDGLNAGTNQPATRAYLDLNSPSRASGVLGGFDIGGDQSWGGQYHTWVVGLEGIGTDTATFSVYLDGSLVHAIRQPFLVGRTIGPGWVFLFQLGANINNGPDNPQSRWWKEFSVLTAKPSNLP